MKIAALILCIFLTIGFSSAWSLSFFGLFATAQVANDSEEEFSGILVAGGNLHLSDADLYKMLTEPDSESEIEIESESESEPLEEDFFIETQVERPPLSDAPEFINFREKLNRKFKAENIENRENEIPNENREFAILKEKRQKQFDKIDSFKKGKFLKKELSPNAKELINLQDKIFAEISSYDEGKKTLKQLSQEARDFVVFREDQVGRLEEIESYKRGDLTLEKLSDEAQDFVNFSDKLDKKFSYDKSAL